MRKKLLACLIAAAASLGTELTLADESADAAFDAVVDVETTVEAVVTTDESSVAADDSTGGDIPAGDGTTPELVVDPAPVSEELPAYDVVDEGSGAGHVDPVVDEEPVAAEGPVDEQTRVDEEKPAVDEEQDVVDDEDIVSEEEPVALEGGEVPVEGGGTAELYTTTSAEGADGEAVMYQTRGPEGCMECRTLTGAAENLGPEAPPPEVTADVIDDNATSPSRAKRQSSQN
jgi:hypothetical protein